MSNPLQIVDISTINKSTADELLEAATSQGFLFVEGHGFSEEEVAQLFTLSKDFFSLPDEYKLKFQSKNSGDGYSTFNRENLDPKTQKNGDPKEVLNITGIDFTTGQALRGVPDWFDGGEKKSLLESTLVRLYELTLKIHRILAMALEIEDVDGPGLEYFDKRYHPQKECGTTLRFLHYPGQKSLDPQAVVRAGAHTDYGSMTLLFQQQNQDGLEIYSPVSKKWEPLPFVPGRRAPEAPPIVVNIADQLSYWTAGLLKSTIHRVKFPAHVQQSGRDRYSIVFFSHPSDDTLLDPVPSEKIRHIKGRGANSAKTVLTAKEHLEKRLKGTYSY